MPANHEHQQLPPVSDGNGNARAPRPDVPAITGYRILDKLGEGGMGTVWRAVQLSTSRVVALKLLSPAMFGSDKARARFEREVALAARLEHPHIARLYDSGLTHGVYFYAMELVKGLPLDDHVRQHRCSQAAILQLLETICRAVDHAHQQGIIHTDLKPSNIMVTTDGQPRLLDFGLAKSVWGDEALVRVSAPGQVAGTPAYMSPEQAAGERTELDARTDVFSLGSMMYVLLLGQYPHDVQGGWAEVMRRIATGQVRRPRKLNPLFNRELERILLKALARNRDQRYATAAALADAIATFRHRAATAAGRSTAQPHVAPWRAVGIAAVLAVMAGATWWWWREQDRPVPTTAGPSSPPTTTAVKPTPLPAAAIRWRTELEQADRSYDAGQFEKACREYDRALEAMRQDQQTDPTVRQTFEESARKYRGLAQFVLERGALSPEKQIEVTQKKLRELNPEYEGTGTFEIENGQIVKASFWSVTTLGDIAPLKGLPLKWLGLWECHRLAEIRALKGMPLVDYLSLYDCRVSDLQPLEGMRLRELHLSFNPILDLAPLAGMPLRTLNLYGTKVTDLSPLKGLPLTFLVLGSPVRDLSPLAGMALTELQLVSTTGDLRPIRGLPLRTLKMHDVPLVDLSPLEGMHLETLIFQAEQVRSGWEIIRGMKTLQVLDDASNWYSKQTPAEFWKRYDAGEFRRSPDGTTPASAPVPAAAGARPRFAVDGYRTALYFDGAQAFPQLNWTILAHQLDDATLSNLDVLVATHCSRPKPYTAAEVAAVERFVQRGGGLLIAGITWGGVTYGKFEEKDYPSNQLGAPFGLSMPALSSRTHNYALQPVRLANSPLTAGLAGLDKVEGVDLGVQSPITVGGKATPLVWDADGNVLCAITEAGRGRVLMMPSNYLRVEVVQNSPGYATFINRLLRWLAAGLEPAR